MQYKYVHLSVNWFQNLISEENLQFCATSKYVFKHSLKGNEGFCLIAKVLYMTFKKTIRQFTKKISTSDELVSAT